VRINRKNTVLADGARVHVGEEESTLMVHGWVLLIGVHSAFITSQRPCA